MAIEFRPRPFNPETDVKACLLVNSKVGGILTKQIGVPDARIEQKGTACNPRSKLPNKHEASKIAMTTDSRFVTCPDCQKTEAFQQLFASQTGHIFDAKKIADGIPLDPVPVEEQSSTE